MVLFTVRDLEDKASGIQIRLRVITKDEPRTVKTKDGTEHRVVDVHVGDRTGTTYLSLWDERTKSIDIGDIIDIENGYVSRFKGRLRLNIGKFGTLEKVEDPGFPSIEALRHQTRHPYWRKGTRRKTKPQTRDKTSTNPETHKSGNTA